MIYSSHLNFWFCCELHRLQSCTNCTLPRLLRSRLTKSSIALSIKIAGRSVFLALLLVLFSYPAFSWNSVGHELVAQIAYDQLTPKEKNFWKHRIEALRVAYPQENFILASILPDELRKHSVNAFSAWHFIDLPIFLGQRHFHYFINPQNVVWAINQSVQVEEAKYANSFEKAFFGSFLIHLVADAHQPLHCASLYSPHFPKGDRGGNLFIIKNYKTRNLHAYWDQGGGFLNKALIKNSMTLEVTAESLEKKYPKAYFAKRATILNPKVWAHESHAIAEKEVYKLSEYSHPSQMYQKNTQEITQEQIVLAGYRLGFLLHAIYITSGN